MHSIKVQIILLVIISYFINLINESNLKKVNILNDRLSNQRVALWQRKLAGFMSLCRMFCLWTWRNDSNKLPIHVTHIYSNIPTPKRHLLLYTHHYPLPRSTCYYTLTTTHSQKAPVPHAQQPVLCLTVHPKCNMLWASTHQVRSFSSLRGWSQNNTETIKHAKQQCIYCRVMIFFFKFTYSFKGIANLEMAKSHVFVLMQISYPYIVWNNFPKFQKNRARSFWNMHQSMCIIVVLPWWEVLLWGGRRPHKLDRYPFRKMRKSQKQYLY